MKPVDRRVGVTGISLRRSLIAWMRSRCPSGQKLIAILAEGHARSMQQRCAATGARSASASSRLTRVGAVESMSSTAGAVPRSPRFG